MPPKLGKFYYYHVNVSEHLQSGPVFPRPTHPEVSVLSVSFWPEKQIRIQSCGGGPQQHWLTNVLTSGVQSCWSAYQIYFGVLFNNALMFLWVVAIPAITLSIIVHGELDLSVFIWSNPCSCEFGTNFSGSLVGQNER